MTPMIAENNIAISQVSQHAYGIGFLSQIGMRSTEEHTLWKVLQNGFFKSADCVKHVVSVFKHQANYTLAGEK